MIMYIYYIYSYLQEHKIASQEQSDTCEHTVANPSASEQRKYVTRRLYKALACNGESEGMRA